MDALIEQLKKELNLPENEAVAIIRAITEFVENQHPVLKDLTRDLMNKELDKINNVHS